MIKTRNEPFLHSVLLISGWILTKFEQIQHLEKYKNFGDLDLISKVTRALRMPNSGNRNACLHLVSGINGWTQSKFARIQLLEKDNL